MGAVNAHWQCRKTTSYNNWLSNTNTMQNFPISYISYTQRKRFTQYIHITSCSLPTQLVIVFSPKYFVLIVILLLLLFNDNFCLALIEDLYCFLYKSNSDKISKSAGWDSFDLEKEFKRMNVPNKSWSLTTLNKDYQVDFLLLKAQIYSCKLIIIDLYYYSMVYSYVILTQSSFIFHRLQVHPFYWGVQSSVVKKGCLYLHTYIITR